MYKTTTQRNCHQCSTCAYRDGSEANREPTNRLKAELCALAGLPFYCHEGLDWQLGDRAINDAFAVLKNERVLTQAGIPKAAILRAKLPILEGHKLQVCAGWKSEIQKLTQIGWFQDAQLNKTRRTIASMAIQALQDFVSIQDDTPAREKARQTLATCIDIFREDRRIASSRMTQARSHLHTSKG